MQCAPNRNKFPNDTNPSYLATMVRTGNVKSGRSSATSEEILEVICHVHQANTASKPIAPICEMFLCDCFCVITLASYNKSHKKNLYSIPKLEDS